YPKIFPLATNTISLRQNSCITAIQANACDHSLFYTEVNFPLNNTQNKFNCHMSIPFENPSLCSTEGSVRQYDIREKTSCDCEGCEDVYLYLTNSKDVIIHVPNQIHSMDVCPTRSYECALALNNTCVQFYDRRKLFRSARSIDSGRSSFMFNLNPKPRHSNNLHTGFTSIKYSKDGTEFVCNYVGDSVMVASCDFNNSMEPIHYFSSNPECYSRTSYFDPWFLIIIIMTVKQRSNPIFLLFKKSHIKLAVFLVV
ncbi:hypothetical protein MXB_3399, partial [Myxobolus squamalis]